MYQFMIILYNENNESYYCFRYHCIKCNTSCHGNQVAWRYRLVVTIADSTAIGTVVVFGRTLDPLFGKTASDFHRYVWQALCAII